VPRRREKKRKRKGEKTISGRRKIRQTNGGKRPPEAWKKI
jgi:hypothetical protein